jgi:peptide/nickel transport system permease protein
MRNRRSLRIGLSLVAVLLLLGVLAPVLANDKPILLKPRDGRLMLPVLADYPLPVAWRSALAGSPRQWWNPPGGTRFALQPAVPYSVTSTDLDAILQPPSRHHWLGTDGLGRDVAARMIHGAGTSMAVGLFAVLIALGIGVVLGSVAGYFGGGIDTAVSRLLEIVFCFPTLVLILALVGVPGSTGMLPIIVAIGLTRWTTMARYVRGEFLSLRQRDFVRSARAAGASDARIIFRHILPHSLSPVLVTAAFGVSGAVLLEAALSFLGFGIQPPTPSWGGILAEARDLLERGWWLACWPTVAIFLTVLGFNLIGDGLRDRMDPRATTNPG